MRGNYLKTYRQAFMMCLCWITLLFPLYPVHSQNLERSQSQVTSFTDSSAYHADKKDKKKLRQQYYEQLHRTAPEVDWKQMDQNARIAKAKSRFQRVRTQRQLEDGMVTIAQGKLKGTWREIGSKNLSGRIHLAEYDPGNDQVYLGSAPGNIWKSKLDGNNWQVQNDLMRISHLIQLRRIPHGNQHRIIAASSQPKFGVVYSDDDGLTWNFANGLKFYAEWGYLDKMVIANDPGHTVYVLVNEWDNQNWGGITSVYASHDQGENFVMLQSFRHSTFGDAGKFDIWTDYYGSGKVYLLENNHIRKLDDENRFRIMGTISLVDDRHDIRLTGRETSAGTYLYALYPDRNVNESDIYQSKDDGKNWAFRGTVSQRPFHENSFESSRVNPEHVFIGGVECFRSYDGGITWEIVNQWGHYYENPAINLHADICGIQSFVTKSGKEFILVSTDGGTYISDDELLTVKNISLSGLNVSQYYSVYTNRNNTEIIYAGSQDQGIQRSTSDNGSIRDFEQMLSGDYGHIVSGDGGKSIWANYPGFSIYYPDAENSTYSKRWYFSGNGYHDFTWMRPLMPDPASPEKVFLAGGSISGTGGSHIIHLNASGGSIQAEELPYNFKAASGGIISAMAYSPIDPNYRYVMTENGRFFLSTDGGNSWKMTQGFDGPDHFWLYGSSILPSRSQLGKVYIAGSGYSNPPVFVSDNHGKDFVAMSKSMPSTLVYQLDANPDESLIFAATEIGPYVYITENGQWYDMDGTSAPDQIYWTVDYVPELRTARFGTHGRGIFDFKINTLPLVVVNPLTNVQVAKNAAPIDIDLSEVFSDAEDPFSALSLTASSSNTSVVTTSINSGTLTLNFVTNATGTANVTVRATDTGEEFVEDVFTVSVTDPGVSFEVLYRVNAGGGSLSGKPAWESDGNKNPSPYRTGGTRGAVSAAITLDGSVPSGVPANLFKTERYWKAKQTPMVWSFPVQTGNQLEVRVYLAETHFNAAGLRVFDILIDGVVVDNDIDVYSLVGHDVGMMRSYETVSDGMVDISFGRVVENPAIKGIEIMGESSGQNLPPIADRVPNQLLKDSYENNSEPVMQESVQLSVYPNPATGKVNIVFRGDEANHTVIEIFNMLGHPLHRFDGNGNVEEEVNVSRFYKGVYVVRAITEGKIFSKRLIIE